MKTNAKPKRNYKNLPVSKKAYIGFLERIEEVFASNKVQCSMMTDVLDRYLAGDVHAGESLDPELRFGWLFLRQNVDVAIGRSRRARERAALRRNMRDGLQSLTDKTGDAPAAVDVCLPAGQMYESCAVTEPEQKYYVDPFKDMRRFKIDLARRKREYDNQHV